MILSRLNEISGVRGNDCLVSEFFNCGEFLELLRMKFLTARYFGC